ncbi:MAG: SurA N-terminal domain-containing protein [Candidatus Adiutrix sp.]|jgi:peptidyl-prolyl cis-trans isomerase D|nr:SurA N-terminal domain-containing protein [Candidatus Adiutrix sp.]
MLAYMRKNANSTVVWLIIGAIAVVFVFFGLGQGGGGGELVTVNGEEADPYEYEDLVREATGRQQRQSGGDLPPEAERLIRLSAVSEQVNRILIRQFSQNMGLNPSPQTVGRTIAALEAFQVDGRFNLERYQAALKARRQEPGAFENEVRKNLAADQATALVTGLARAYLPEAAELFHFQEDQVRFDYLFLADEDGHWELNPTPEDITAYYASHQEKWRRPAEMTVEYVEIRPADFLDRVDLPETDLEAYYKENLDRFQKPETAEVSQILFRFPSLTPTDEEKKTTLARAEAALARLDQGDDFAALARELSDDRTTAENGGVMGALTRGTAFPAFEEAAFSAPLNGTAGPVVTDAGYHLLLVTARRPAGPSPLTEVRTELTEELKAARARNLAVSRLEDLLTRVEVNPDLAAAARSLDLRAALSRVFTADDPPGFFENNAEAVRKAFQTPLNRMAPPFEGDRVLVLYYPRSRQESRIPPLDEVRAEAEQAWRAEESSRRTGEVLESYRPQIQAQGWADYVAALPPAGPLKSGAGALAGRYSLAAAPPFNQSEPQALAAALHSVARPGQITPLSLAGQLDGRPGRFLLYLAEYRAADAGRLDGPEGLTFQRLLSLNKANLMFQVWRAGLYEASQDRIVIPQYFLQ